MSQIYFHTREDHASIQGAERHSMASIISNLTFGIMMPMLRHFGDGEPRILEYLSPDSYLRMTHDLVEGFRIFLSANFSEEDRLYLGDQSVSTLSLCLNTAMKVGPDPIRLGARIHGQSEIHGYILPQHHGWCAEIIRRGLKDQIYREGMGWDRVLQLIDRTENSPIVMSYSVTDVFPNPWVARWEDKNEGEDWYELSTSDQWNLAMIGLLEQKKTNSLEITPDYWKDFHFSTSLTAFNFLHHSE